MAVAAASAEAQAEADAAWQEHMTFEQELAHVDLVLEEATEAMPMGMEASFQPLLELLHLWGPRGILRATSTICAQRHLQEENPRSRGNPPEIFRRECWESALRIILQFAPCQDDMDTFGVVLCGHWRKAHGICLDVEDEELIELTEALQEVWRLIKDAEDAMRQSAEQESLSAEKALLEALDAEEGRTVRDRKKRERRRQKERQKRCSRTGVEEAVAAVETPCEESPSMERSGQQDTESSSHTSADASVTAVEPTEATVVSAAEAWWHEAAHQLLAEWKAPIKEVEARWHEAAHKLLAECRTAAVSSAEVRWHEVARQLLTEAYRHAVAEALSASSSEKVRESAVQDSPGDSSLEDPPKGFTEAAPAFAEICTDAATTDAAEPPATTPLASTRVCWSPQSAVEQPASLSSTPASVLDAASPATPSGQPSPSSSARRSQRRRRQRAEAKARAAASEHCAASATSSVASTCAASGSASTVSAAWSEEDETASCFSRRTSAGELTSIGLSGSPAKPQVESIGGSPTASRSVVTWSDLLGSGSAFPATGGKSTMSSMRPPPPPPPAAPPRLGAALAAQTLDQAQLVVPAGSSAVPTAVPQWSQGNWSTAAGGLPGMLPSVVPHSDAWAIAPPMTVPLLSPVNQAHGSKVMSGLECGADALRSWLDASGLPSGAALEAQLQAVAPEAYED